MSNSDNLAPKGVEAPKYVRGYTMRSMFVPAGKEHAQTFKVTPKFTKLDVGVRFNVEDVPQPINNHDNKAEIPRDQLFQAMKNDAASFYTNEFAKNIKQDKYSFRRRLPENVKAESVRLEAASMVEGKLVYTGGDGFFKAAVCAFAQHLPLIISPDDIWTLISYAFARHVDLNAEKLRKNFVKHKGKKRIVIETREDFQISNPGNPDSGAPSERWENEVFSQFSKQIKAHIGDKVHGIIVADFATTTPSARAASEIGLMSAMKNYFSYGMMRTCCGIPEITLLGEEDDWISLVERTKALGKLMTKEFTKYWLPNLIPVLEQFVESFQGNVNYSFWQTIVKLRHTGGGSGAHSFISGWIQILFPYLTADRLNYKMGPWNKVFFDGPEPYQFPNILSSAPVDWKYSEKEKYDLHFHSGFVGYVQDKDGRLQSSIGWYVTHDPEKPVSFEVAKIQKEIEDLIAGNFKKGMVLGDYQESNWYKRVKDLEQRENELINLLDDIKKREAENNIRRRVKLD